MTIIPLHEDDTGCEHPGLPVLAGPHGPAVCSAGTRVTHLRVAEGQVWELGAAVSAIQQVGQMLATWLTPVLTEIARWASALTTDPGFQAAAAAAAVLDVARLEHERAVHAGGPGAAAPPPLPAGLEPAVDPCGDGPVASGGQLPGEVPLPF